MQANNKGLKFGLNIKGKKKFDSKPVKNIFDEEEEDHESVKAVDKVNKDIQRSQVKIMDNKKLFEQVKETLEVDPTAYEYDEVYDQMKENEKKAIQAIKGDDKKPKYINGMLVKAELRKRDRLRAEEKLMEKEREREGELYKDKEKFVTTAYKKQQEELRLLEEQDNVASNQGSSGMKEFYQNVLATRSRQIEAAIITGEDKKKPILKEEKEEKEDLLKKALEEGKNIEFNANNEVIDKRQYLSAGLNLVKKSKASKEEHQEESQDYNQNSYEAFVMRRKKAQEEKLALAKKSQANRMAQTLKNQISETKASTEKEKNDKLDHLKEALKRKNDDTSVLDAKARYLLRKKQNQESAS